MLENEISFRKIKTRNKQKQPGRKNGVGGGGGGGGWVDEEKLS